MFNTEYNSKIDCSSYLDNTAFSYSWYMYKFFWVHIVLAVQTMALFKFSNIQSILQISSDFQVHDNVLQISAYIHIVYDWDRE